MRRYSAHERAHASIKTLLKCAREQVLRSASQQDVASVHFHRWKEMCERAKHSFCERAGTSESLRERGTSSSKLEVRKKVAGSGRFRRNVADFGKIGPKSMILGQIWAKIAQNRWFLDDFKPISKKIWPKFDFLFRLKDFLFRSIFDFEAQNGLKNLGFCDFMPIPASRFLKMMCFQNRNILWFHADAGFWIFKNDVFWAPKTFVLVPQNESFWCPKMVDFRTNLDLKIEAKIGPKIDFPQWSPPFLGHF